MKRIILTGAMVALVSACGVFKSDPTVYNKPRSEEIVDVGYGKEVRGNLTTAVSSVDVDTYANTSYRNIYEMIAGKCAGVQVEGNKITIRGINTVNAGTDPLFIVDGAAYNSIDWVNPNDVKSIDVLKDAGSASIYGVRGANGVIIINLK
jgi:TonB-dependent SusC/RagA subfamily outer membrane receptor